MASFGNTGDRQFPARRQSRILTILRQEGQVTTKALAHRLQVSEDTIRRDLDVLVEAGRVERVHGGASLMSTAATINLPLARRLNTNVEAKDRIARLAATFIHDSDTVLINGGTTTLSLPRYLDTTLGITIVTNSMRLPERFINHNSCEIYVIGGPFKFHSETTIGVLGVVVDSHVQQEIYADVACIGVGGISDQGIISTSYLPEVPLIRSMIDHAQHTLILADHNKFGRSLFAEIMRADSRLTFITDAPPEPALVHQLEKLGATVLVAPQGAE